MSLDELLKPVERVIPECKLQRIINELDEPYKTALVNLTNTLYYNGGLSDQGLSNRLKAAGYQVSIPVVNRHRNKSCSCYRTE